MNKFLILLPLALTGCAQTPLDVKPVELAFNQADLNGEQSSLAYTTLMDSASMSSEALRELSSLANGKASLDMSEKDYNEYVFQKDYIPVGMEVDVDMNWDADFYPVVLTLADLSGYKVAEPIGRQIGEINIKINTSLSKKGNNVISILRMINDTHKDRLKLVVQEKLKIIEIIYL